MKNLQIRFVLSVITIFSILMTITTAFAAPVKFNQVVQIINAKPDKAKTGGFSQLRLAGGELVSDGDDEKDSKNNDGKNKKTAPPQDDRVIIETTSEIVEDDVCDCDQPQIAKGKFPYWALLGLTAVPLLFLIPHGDDDDTPTPTPNFPTTMTPTPTMTMTPTMTPTPTMTMTPTPTITPTPTMTPPMSPTPPDAVPEPMTLLLFGTGLASIGAAARKKFGRKDNEEVEE